MFLLRHGQSYFNLHFSETRVDPGIEDPELTELGQEQAVAAAARLREAEITAVIVSPYTRALQTMEPILAMHPVPVEVMHEVRERTAFVCDVGSHPDLLRRRFPRYDFSHLPPRWWHESRESTQETIDRANGFRALMRQRGDSATTQVVSHWAFILALTGVSVTNGEVLDYDPNSPAPEKIIWRP
jgi:broad specificity phosphatase PhoE